MVDELPRSRQARAAAEQALVRVVHHYGGKPEFVVLGGLVPELLCSESPHQHAGTTDIDVQVNLEIECGAVNTERLELALRNSEFEPDEERVWRWRFEGEKTRALVKFELLADRDDQPQGVTFKFENCEHLGAANLRGTRFAVEDVEVRQLTAKVGGDWLTVDMNVTGVAGFLLAKCAAAHSRRQPKDWYDIAFVLLHNDLGGPAEAANAVTEKFRSELSILKTPLDDLAANFTDPESQGPMAYSGQYLIEHPELDSATVKADAILAVETFIEILSEYYN
jgi:hypothetical protein